MIRQNGDIESRSKLNSKLSDQNHELIGAGVLGCWDAGVPGGLGAVGDLGDGNMEKGLCTVVPWALETPTTL
jgi:hypothetical protein